jgi:predicted nucleic acid-binding protein
VGLEAAGGPGTSCIIVAALVDTNVLLYPFDRRFPEKQRIATDLLRNGIAAGDLRLPHQAILEFVSVVTRPLGGTPLLLDRVEAYREAEELLAQFDVLYPNDALVRSALRGAATYGLSWFDAHLWAYAEHFDLDIIWSEDFEHDRLYGTVRMLDPFRSADRRNRLRA